MSNSKISSLMLKVSRWTPFKVCIFFKTYLKHSIKTTANGRNKTENTCLFFHADAVNTTQDASVMVEMTRPNGYSGEDSAHNEGGLIKLLKVFLKGILKREEEKNTKKLHSG